MKGQKKQRTGVVVSNKMDKTIAVVAYRTTKHPLYKKYIKQRIRFKAHDAANACQVGDTVLLQETRPLSREKRWRVVEIVEKAV